MSEEERLYKMSVLRGYLVAIPIKVFLCSIFIGIEGGHNKYSEMNFENIFELAISFMLMYSLISVFTYFSKSCGSWFLGGIMFVILICFFSFAGSAFPVVLDRIVAILFIIGSVIIDIWRIYQYVHLSRLRISNTFYESERRNKEYNTEPPEVEYYNANNQYRECGTSPQTQEQGFNPFAGCTDEESLKKRYRDLSKSFHPDMNSGDNESMQFINSEYERLLEKYK